MAVLEYTHPTFLERLYAALADYPDAYVLSGGRSNARQAQLYADFLAGTGNPANPPGTSWHEYDESAPWPNVGPAESAATRLTGGCWSLAVDLAGDYLGITRNAARYNLCFPINGEPWHAQPAEVPEAQRTAGAWRRIPLASTPPPPPVDADPLHLRGRTALRFIGE